MGVEHGVRLRAGREAVAQAPLDVGAQKRPEAPRVCQRITAGPDEGRHESVRRGPRDGAEREAPALRHPPVRLPTREGDLVPGPLQAEAEGHAGLDVSPRAGRSHHDPHPDRPPFVPRRRVESKKAARPAITTSPRAVLSPVSSARPPTSGVASRPPPEPNVMTTEVAAPALCGKSSSAADCASGAMPETASPTRRNPPMTSAGSVVTSASAMPQAVRTPAPSRTRRLPRRATAQALPKPPEA